MCIHIITKIIIVSILFLYIPCSGQNLISNPSFEINGKPYCGGWYENCSSQINLPCDSVFVCGLSIIRDSPPDSNSGEWCLRVYGSFPTSDYAVTYISGQTGTNIYQLSFWMNTEHFEGEAYIGPMKNRMFIDSNYVIDFSQPWTQYTLTDTITTNFEDTIGVLLTAGIGDFCLCDVYFDQIELTITDSLSTGYDLQTKSPSCTIFPNPCNDYVTFQTPYQNGFNFSIFDMNGKEVKSGKSYTVDATLDLNEIPCGIYFYQLTPNDNSAFPVYGRLISQ